MYVEALVKDPHKYSVPKDLLKVREENATSPLKLGYLLSKTYYRGDFSLININFYLTRPIVVALKIISSIISAEGCRIKSLDDEIRLEISLLVLSIVENSQDSNNLVYTKGLGYKAYLSSDKAIVYLVHMFKIRDTLTILI